MLSCLWADGNQANATYDVPGHGRFLYCGLQGVMSEYEKIRADNNLGHAICDNLRAGDWLPGYCADRLVANPATTELGVLSST